MKKNILNKLYVLFFIGFLVFHGCSLILTAPENKNGAELKEGTEVVKEGAEESENKEDTARISEFILGPGDKLEIAVYRNNDLKQTVQIDSSGKIMYPLVGDIQAAGMGIFQLRDKIRDGLIKYIVDPQVTVGVISVQSQKVVVLGEVKNPGFFQAETSVTILEAISRAGGFTHDGEQESVLLIRGGMKKPELITLNIEKVLKEGDLTQNIVIQSGDIIYIPRTFISDVDRFFMHLSTIISPLLNLESGYYIGQHIESIGSAPSIPAR